MDGLGSLYDPSDLAPFSLGAAGPLAALQGLDPMTLATIMSTMTGQPPVPTTDATPDPVGYGISGSTLPESALAPLGPSYHPSVAAPSYDQQGPEVYYPHAAPPHAPKTKAEWLQALMPAILGIAGGAFGGKAGVAGALKGYAEGQQQDLVNAQRQQQIDQQRAVLESNERRYKEMERLRQENNDRLKSVAGSNLLEKALKGAAQLNDPTAQAAYLKAHAPELASYGFDLTKFSGEVSQRATQRTRDWARKVLEEQVNLLIKVHGPNVDLGPYFSENPPSKVQTDGGSLGLREIAKMADVDPNTYIVSPTELKQRQLTQLAPDVQLQVNAKVEKWKDEHGGQLPGTQDYAAIALQAKKDVGEASRAETTLELAQELAQAQDLPPDQAITFLSEKAGTTEQELRQAAEQYARGGGMINLGFGGLIPRQAIKSAASILYPNENLGKNTAEMHAAKALLDQQVKAVNNLTQFENAALKNMRLAEEMRAKAPDLGGQFWTTPVQALAEKGFGDADVKAARTALANASREVQRVVTDPLLRGHLTIYASKKADEILPPTATLQEVQAVMDVLRRDMANVGDSVTSQLQHTRNWMSRPLMGPEGTYVDRKGQPAFVNGEGLMVDEQGQVLNLDDYGNPKLAGPPTGAARPTLMPTHAPRGGPAVAPTTPNRNMDLSSAAPPKGAAPQRPVAPTVFDQLSSKAQFPVKDPATGKVWLFPTQKAADDFTKVLASRRGF